jgi:type IV secretion system protein VirB6
LIALLVFLVLRQVMPIASGLAGGTSLSSFGIASRGVSKARPYVAGTLGAVARGTGLVVRDAAAQSRQALARNWRNWRR